MILLASASTIRKTLLRNAGLAISVVPADIDEMKLKIALRQNGEKAASVARRLAEAKALAVATRHPADLVIGADQMLECAGQWFDKPNDRSEAREQLKILRGKTHNLLSAVVLARGPHILWHHLAESRLTIRNFSDAFLENYLTLVGEEISTTVGAYQLEGLGAQLFSEIVGDHFAILGLPMLPLLDQLRQQGALPS